MHRGPHGRRRSSRCTRRTSRVSARTRCRPSISRRVSSPSLSDAGLNAPIAVRPDRGETMTHAVDPYQDIREAIRDLCAGFPAAYFREIDEKRGYPDAFVDALTKAGWLAALIPQEYGGSGLGLAEASVIMEEINRCGGNSGACHGQMYVMSVLVRHGSQRQKREYLPRIASG